VIGRTNKVQRLRRDKRETVLKMGFTKKVKFVLSTRAI
jgi:hypothetical protein